MARDGSRTRHEGSIPPHIADHLIRDIGPTAAAQGGDLFMMASVVSTWSRGVSAGGHLQG